MTEIEAADAPPVAGRVSHADAIPEMRETEAGPSTVTRGDKPLSAYETFKAMPLSERCMYAFAALPVLPVLLLVGPIIAAAKCAEGDNSRYYKDPVDDDGDETPERRREMLALRQAGYGDRVAVSLGNVPTGVIHNDYSFRVRNAQLRKPAGIKSGSKPVKSANELWLSHKDEPAPGGTGSRDKTPNGSVRDATRAGAIVNGGEVAGSIPPGAAASGSPRSSNGGSRESSTRNGSHRARGRAISFNDAEVFINDAAKVLDDIRGDGVVRSSDPGVRPVRSSLDRARGLEDASTSGETTARSAANQNQNQNQNRHVARPALRHPGSPSRWGAPKPLTSDEVWAANGSSSPRRSLDGAEQEELARGGGRFRRMGSAAENENGDGGDGGDGVRERGDSASGSLLGDVEAEARRTLELDASTVLVKPFTETLHPSPKQVVPITGGDPKSGGVAI